MARIGDEGALDAQCVAEGLDGPSSHEPAHDTGEQDESDAEHRRSPQQVHSPDLEILLVGYGLEELRG
jgi:hypothetical protein